MGRSYGLQFHIEVPLDLATEWGEVPAYAKSLESTLGPGALDRLLADVADHAPAMVAVARGSRTLARAGRGALNPCPSGGRRRAAGGA